MPTFSTPSKSKCRLPRPSSNNLKQLFKSVCKHKTKDCENVDDDKFKAISTSPYVTRRQKKKKVRRTDPPEVIIPAPVCTSIESKNSDMILWSNPLSNEITDLQWKKNKREIVTCERTSLLSISSGKSSKIDSCTPVSGSHSSFGRRISNLEPTTVMWTPFEESSRVWLSPEDGVNNEQTKARRAILIDSDNDWKNSRTPTLSATCDASLLDDTSQRALLDNSVMEKASICSLASSESSSSKNFEQSGKRRCRKKQTPPSPSSSGGIPWVENRSFFLRVTESRRKRHQVAWQSTKTKTYERCSLKKDRTESKISSEVEQLNRIIKIQKSEIDSLRYELINSKKSLVNIDDGYWCKVPEDSQRFVTSSENHSGADEISSTRNIESPEHLPAAWWRYEVKNAATQTTDFGEICEVAQNRLSNSVNFKKIFKSAVLLFTPQYLLLHSVFDININSMDHLVLLRYNSLTIGKLYNFWNKLITKNI
uniref:Uncharacterized protein n=1 Tax=Ciona savignyi TaxID=51511 RepID=H2Z274_CIOSA